MFDFCFFALFTTNASGNLIVNGDFEAGNTGFSSQYAYNPSANPSSVSSSLQAAQYTLTTDPALAHISNISYGDHSTGSGLMLMANGATSPIDVWSQTVSVTPNTLYLFKGYVAQWQGGPAQLDIRVNSSSIGVFTAAIITNVSQLGTWEEFTFSFNSGASSSITLSIADLNTALSGNDFTLDDLSLVAVPIPSALWLFGTGLLGLIGISRRKKAA